MTQARFGLSLYILRWLGPSGTSFPEVTVLFGRFAKSPFLLLFVCLFLMDCAIKYSKPLRYIEMGGYIPTDQNPLADKYEALKFHTTRTKILLVGSSLPMCAAACSDYRAGALSSIAVDYDLFTYTGAKYFESLLREMTGREVPVFNYCGNGCMASDSYLLVQQAISRGMHPKAVVLALAPRDFIDHIAPKPGQTAYYDFFRKLSNNDVDLTALKPQEVFSKSLGHVWHYYSLKPDYQALFSVAASGFMHRPLTLYSSENKPLQAEFAQVRLAGFGQPNMADVTGDEEKQRKDLRQYNISYIPIDMKRFSAECSFLFKTLELCRKQNILPIVVNMPRTARNQDILPAWFQKEYLNTLTEASNKYQCPFYDLHKEPNFTESDFRDSVHLNGDGGMKVFNLLTAKLSKDDQFLAAIDNKQLSLK